MKTASHQVGHFEIPADGVDNLKNFYSSFIWLKWGNTRLLYDKKRRKCSMGPKKKPTTNTDTICLCRIKAKQLRVRAII